MSRQHQVRQGYIARAWLTKPTVTRVDGTSTTDASMLFLGNGSNGANNNNAIIDSSSNALTISTNGTPAIGSANPFTAGPSYNAAVNGGSLLYDSTQNTRISTPNNQSLFDFGTGDFTIEWWMFNTVTWTSQTNPGIMGHKAGDSTAGWQLYRDGVSNTTRITLRLSAGGGVNLDYHSNSTPTVGVWEHFAVAREGTTLRWFKDGALTNTFTGVSVNVAGSTGVFYSGFSQTWGGYGSFFIAGARVVKGTAVYTAAFTKPTAPPTNIAGTSILLLFNNAGVFDTACKINATTRGNTIISTAQSKFGGSSILFDGSGDYMDIYNIPSLNVGTGAFTIDWWMRTAGTQDDNSVIFSKWSALNSGTEVLTIGNPRLGTNANKIEVRLTGNPTIASTTNINDNNWHYIVYSRGGTNGYLYVDGNLEGSTLNYSPSTSVNLATSRIGRPANNTTANFDYWGYLEDFRITPGLLYPGTNFTPPTTEATYNNLTVYNLTTNNVYGVYQTNIEPDDDQYVAPINTATIPTENLITLYDAANVESYPGTGTTLFDISGNLPAKNQTLYNGVTWSSTGPSYFTFDGVNDIMGTGTVMPTTMSSTTTGIFTIMVWFRTPTTNQGRKILGFELPADVTLSTAYDRQFYLNTSGQLVWGIHAGPSGIKPQVGPTISANTWYCAAAVQRRSPTVQNEFYVNGVSYGTSPFASADTANALYLKLGGRGLTGWTGGTTGHWAGDIAYFVLYDRAMTTAEVQQLYNLTKGRFN